jgi:electron-transferring-flavoprotein dehydrogenase
MYVYLAVCLFVSLIQFMHPFISEIGSHILSGNVFDPIALNELLPEQSGDPNNETHWTQQLKQVTGSIATPVTNDEFRILTSSESSFKIPNVLLPPQLHNEHKNYIISLSQLCRYLASVAEGLGVEIYPGFAASEVLVHPDRQCVYGVATRDVGIAKDGITRKDNFERGVELRARQTLFAEGARGSCSEWLMQRFQLRTKSDPSTHPQSYGLGLKEVWQVPPEQFQSGLVQHTLGFPLQSSVTDKVFGGSFLYHQEPDLVLIGFVVGLDYENPYLNPYQEFQKWKTHAHVRTHLEGGTCLSYGARVLNEGGYHSIPHLTVPGGALIGCSAGFLNSVKIKGTHTAMKSGMLAADATFRALVNNNNSTVAENGGELDVEQTRFPELVEYPLALQESWVYKELYEVRNAHAAFAKWGTLGGLVHTAISTFITKGKEPWTIPVTKTDSEHTGKANQYTPIQYPAPDGKLTFDLLTNLQRSGTYHTDDQPSHLKIKPECAQVPVDESLQVYAGPEQRFCPAAVYEYVDDSDKNGNNNNNNKSKKLVINAQNCIHCKCCSIKMPKEYIDWTVPEGGGGPQYQIM